MFERVEVPMEVILGAVELHMVAMFKAVMFVPEKFTIIVISIELLLLLIFPMAVMYGTAIFGAIKLPGSLCSNYGAISIIKISCGSNSWNDDFRTSSIHMTVILGIELPMIVIPGAVIFVAEELAIVFVSIKLFPLLTFPVVVMLGTVMFSAVEPCNSDV